MSSLTGIDHILDRIEQESPDATRYYAELTDETPLVAGYLLDGDTDMLSEKEQDYLLFLGMVVTTFLRDNGLLQADVDPELLGRNEESIWNAEGFAAPTEVHPDLVELNDFLEEALLQDEDTDFLEEAGVQIMYAKLYALALTAISKEVNL